MQDALENLFGPAAGLIGLVVFMLMWAPKFVVKWRGARAKKLEKARMKREFDASRSLVLEPKGVEGEEDHVMHGRAVRKFRAAITRTLVLALVLCMPLAAVMVFVPEGYRSLRFILIAIGGFLALLGLLMLRHLGDCAIFYKTGAEWRISGKRYDIDYNSIIDVSPRSFWIPGRWDSAIVRFNDGGLVFLDGLYLTGEGTLPEVFQHLTERKIRSAADEHKRKMSF